MSLKCLAKNGNLHVKGAAQKALLRHGHAHKSEASFIYLFLFHLSSNSGRLHAASRHKSSQRGLDDQERSVLSAFRGAEQKLMSNFKRL